MGKEILVLTANTDDYSRLNPPAFVSNDCDYVAVCSNPSQWYQDNGWTPIKSIPFSNIDSFKSRRDAKVYKILCSIIFSNYKYIVWHDAASRILSDPKLFIETHKEFDILIGKHPSKDCVYEEIKSVKSLKIDYPETMDAQRDFYIKNKMPKKFGLWLGSSFVMKNTESVRELQLMWWEQVCKFSSRDQCSLPYCIYKMGDRLSLKTEKITGALVSQNTTARKWRRKYILGGVPKSYI
jgi:hypothetical protein